MPAFRHALLSATVALACTGGMTTVAHAQAGAAPTPTPAPNALSDLTPARPRTLRATTPKPTPPASAPSPKLRPLDVVGQQAEPPGDMRPERPIAVPQVSVPIGRTPPPPSPGETRAVGARSGIDDSAARCRAQADPAARARCAGG